jgi:hypothetical protein
VLRGTASTSYPKGGSAALHGRTVGASGSHSIALFGASLGKAFDKQSVRGLLSQGKLRRGIGYLRNHADALNRFLCAGRLLIDNDDAERDLRRIGVGRKNW